MALLLAVAPAAAQEPEPPPAGPPDLLALAGARRDVDIGRFKAVLDAMRDPDGPRDARGRTALHLAVREGYQEFSSLLLRRGADPNARDDRGRTPLFKNLKGGGDDARLVRHLLILKGANVNAQAADGSTPLTVALRGGNAAVVETLLRCGASLRPENVPDAEQPFTVAAATGNPKLADLLRRREMLQQARVLHAVPRQPGDDRPDALHDAIMRDDPDGIERLLDAGADIERPDAVNQETPLTRALGYGKVESVFTLLQRGANPNHARPSDGTTPLMNTMGWLGLSLDGMRLYLLLLGADVRASRPDGLTEMTQACQSGNTHGVRWLVWSGVSPTEAGKQGTPMEVASRAGRQNIINMLKDLGVPVVIFKSDDPVWNLHNAAKRGDRAEIDRLLASGTTVDAPDEGGDSPLMQAIGYADMTTARHLLARGASINYQNPKGGWTPLIVTTVWNFPEITTFRAELLQAGADPNLAARDGMTAAMRAACSEDPGTGLRQIVDAGADLNRRDDKGKTVLGQAVANNRKGTAEYLRKHGAQE